MHYYTKLFSLLFLSLLTIACAQANGPHLQANGHYTRAADGIVVYPDDLLSGHLPAVRLSVISDGIIRVVADREALRLEMMDDSGRLVGKL